MNKMNKNEQLGGTSEDLFTWIPEDIILIILDKLSDNSLDVKAFSLTCKYFQEMKCRHKKILRPIHPEFLSRVLIRYPNILEVDLTLCRGIHDSSLSIISNACNGRLKRLDLPMSWVFSTIGVTSLAERCKNLVSLNLSDCPRVSDSTLAAVARMKNLENLWLSGCCMITDTGIEFIAAGCAKLKLINLEQALNITDLGVELIAVKCKEIRSMDLSDLRITSKSLVYVLKLQHLEELFLRGCYFICISTFPNEKHNQSTLKKLDLSSRVNITPPRILQLTNGADSIQQLNFTFGWEVTPLLEIIEHFRFLRNLILDFAELSDSALYLIGNFTGSLHELSMKMCTGVSDEALSSVLSNHRDLRKINISGCDKIKNFSIINIAFYSKKLTSLKMERAVDVDNQTMQSIRKITLLEELDLRINNVDDNVLKSIAMCANLKIFKLRLCWHNIDDGLAAIGNNCANLVEIDLNRCIEITDASLCVIGDGCRKLERVSISYCKKLTDVSLGWLSKSKKLRTLECRGCPLITSYGICKIAVGCHQLSSLDLKYCNNIDDRTMYVLGELSHNLREINLSFTSVKDAGVEALSWVRCLERVAVEHVKGLTAARLGEALMCFIGLRTAKIHKSFRWLIPELDLQILQVHGCELQWSDEISRPWRDTFCVFNN